MGHRKATEPACLLGASQTGWGPADQMGPCRPFRVPYTYLHFLLGTAQIDWDPSDVLGASQTNRDPADVFDASQIKWGPSDVLEPHTATATRCIPDRSLGQEGHSPQNIRSGKFWILTPKCSLLKVAAATLTSRPPTFKVRVKIKVR